MSKQLADPVKVRGAVAGSASARCVCDAVRDVLLCVLWALCSASARCVLLCVMCSLGHVPLPHLPTLLGVTPVFPVHR